ncbi:UDP-N-acetylmuramate dehydrogenase [Candidatus Gottesmanbacteria bacterium]|nr:UDP-N-acetylmuramate dehydrogenase [Candidatus Gottesmanbacteria bacterium]
MKEQYQQLQKILGERLRENELLARYTTFKIGGSADLFYEAKTVEELVAAVIASRKLGIPVWVLGGGSNILIGDKGVRGFVVKNSTSRIFLRGMRGTLKDGKARGNVYVEADSGVIMNKLVRFTVEEGLGGLEMHLGLPGTVGGAIYMNSKWTHPEGYVGDVVYQAEILTPKNERRVIPKTYFQFGYDVSSIQKTGDCVLRAVFSLRQGEKDTLWEAANAAIAYRKQTQPQGVFSPGCTFRNITKAQALAAATPGGTTSAGFLIDHTGLKGITVGRAQISPIHANFIINRGGARASDVLQLISRAKEQVKRQFGVILEEEIIRVGEF